MSKNWQNLDTLPTTTNKYEKKKLQPPTAFTHAKH